MTDQSMDSNHGYSSIDSSELAERINEALEPALDDVAERVAEAVAQRVSQSGVLSESNGLETTEESGDSSESADEVRSEELAADRTHSGTSSDGRDEDGRDARDSDANRDRATRSRSRSTTEVKSNGKDKSEGESLFGRLSHLLLSSFTGSLREEGGDHFESLADTAVEKLFSVRARGWMRDLADRTLQATLYDALSSVDHPSERYELYRDSLRNLRPIIRQAVDAMYTEENNETLRRHLREAIPNVLRGDFQTASTMVVSALSEITDHAEAALWENSREIFEVLQHISTTMLQEGIQHTVEDKVDPEAIQERVQNKVGEAREKLAETVEKLQGGVKDAQSQLQERTGATSGRGRQGASPAGLPPSGFPPSGEHPWGMPPNGTPPNGLPPSGLPPAVERRRKAAQRSRDATSRRRL